MARSIGSGEAILMKIASDTVRRTVYAPSMQLAFEQYVAVFACVSIEKILETWAALHSPSRKLGRPVVGHETGWQEQESCNQEHTTEHSRSSYRNVRHYIRRGWLAPEERQDPHPR